MLTPRAYLFGPTMIRAGTELKVEHYPVVMFAATRRNYPRMRGNADDLATMLPVKPNTALGAGSRRRYTTLHQGRTLSFGHAPGRANVAGASYVVEFILPHILVI